MCVYAINDPIATAAQLSSIYKIVALKFEGVFQYGALFIFFFLIAIKIIAFLKKWQICGILFYLIHKRGSRKFATF